MNNQCKIVPVELLKKCRVLAAMQSEHPTRHLIELDAILDAPVPPAGDVEVLAWKRTWTSHHDSDGSLFEATDFHENHAFGKKNGDTPLVDRAHVTRLTAEVERLTTYAARRDDFVKELQASINDLAAERDALTAKVRELQQ